MTMMTINTAAGMRDLIALTREIETTEGLARRAALMLALHQYREIEAMVAGNCRYVPVGWSLQPHVSWSVGPMVWDAADPLLEVGR